MINKINKGNKRIVIAITMLMLLNIVGVVGAADITLTGTLAPVEIEVLLDTQSLNFDMAAGVGHKFNKINITNNSILPIKARLSGLTLSEESWKPEFDPLTEAGIEPTDDLDVADVALAIGPISNKDGWVFGEGCLGGVTASSGPGVASIGGLYNQYAGCAFFADFAAAGGVPLGILAAGANGDFDFKLWRNTKVTNEKALDMTATLVFELIE